MLFHCCWSAEQCMAAANRILCTIFGRTTVEMEWQPLRHRRHSRDFFSCLCSLIPGGLCMDDTAHSPFATMLQDWSLLKLMVSKRFPMLHQPVQKQTNLDPFPMEHERHFGNYFSFKFRQYTADATCVYRCNGRLHVGVERYNIFLCTCSLFESVN